MNDTSTFDDLRNRLVDEIITKRPLPAPIERALRTVRRDLHLPGLDPADAYTNRAVTIKDNPDGPLALSCASVPSTVAMMLAQLAPQPGDHILEVGAGTGYNAALLAELVGHEGKVTTVDIDPGVVLHARQALNRTGYEHVRVMEHDGLKGAPQHAPYTRMIATVGLWDVPASWWQQLADGGRLVLPLRWRGQARSVALTRQGDTLVSDGMELCGFVPIIGQTGERTTELADGTVRLHHDQDQPVGPDQLAEVLSTPPIELWSQARVGSEETFDGIWLRATASDDAVCRIEVTSKALDEGVRCPAIPGRSPALVSGSSLAYLIAERDNADPERPSRLGAAGYGPDGAALARTLIAHIAAWSADRAAAPHMTIHPAGTADVTLPEGHAIDKEDSRVVLSFAMART
ncbi:methyltransferase, FxLD system [Streptomyces carminius]|uniref:Protein-L-isoaspartate O-methyltransferase n=1 Tax=Streptomyces carminius TaxID=2665496 RepID=A0A2M8LYF2_9ACTN|nr:methyltransferase, FxLD system [Streptomyces carminius]PJE96959.1 methyltransferase, FxLD system [Streptomyces carminius]